MSTTTLTQNSSPGASSRWKRIGVIGAATLAALVLFYIIAASLFPPEIKLSPPGDSIEVPVESELSVTASFLRGQIRAVEVREALLDPLGNVNEERQVPGRMSGGRFVPEDGGPLFRPDARYQVTVTADLLDLSLNGRGWREVSETYEMRTVVTPAPIFVKDKQVVPTGEPIIVEFNTPILAFSYDIAPSVQTIMEIDEDNPSRAFIHFDEYQQGQLYQLTISQAVSEKGTTLQKPYSQNIATTEPLRVTFVPGDGEAGVHLSARPTLTFSENIDNPDDYNFVVSIEPSVLGGWEWTDEKTLEFKPLHDFTQGAEISIRMTGGIDGFRGESGSFLREDVSTTFTTRPSKLIEVDLTAQRVMVYDNDQLVKTLICSSGSKATPSLTGRYAIYAKADKLDMQGEGYNAPNVPWVLMFNGDYTIHGNYWATTFGVPSSHGCIGLPVPDAEWLYNWTPIGTIVSIHY